MGLLRIGKRRVEFWMKFSCNLNKRKNANSWKCTIMLHATVSRLNAVPFECSAGLALGLPPSQSLEGSCCNCEDTSMIVFKESRFFRTTGTYCRPAARPIENCSHLALSIMGVMWLALRESRCVLRMNAQKLYCSFVWVQSLMQWSRMNHWD